MMYRDTHELKILNARLEQIKVPLFISVRDILKHKKMSEIKGLIRDIHLSALYYLFDISLSTEDYEICAAIKQVIAERPLPVAGTSSICRVPANY